jgi:hypothetical protein
MLEKNSLDIHGLYIECFIVEYSFLIMHCLDAGEIYFNGLEKEDMMEMISFVELFPILNLDGHHWISLVLLGGEILDRDSTDHFYGC